MNLVKALGSVGGLTLASRILALVRDSLAARYVGAGFAADAFNGVAFRLPNMFRALFAEGAFSAAFVPMFNKKAEGEEGISEAYRFAERALALLFLDPRPVHGRPARRSLAADAPALGRLCQAASDGGPACLCGHALAHHHPLSGADQPRLAAGRHIELARPLLGECRRAGAAQHRDDRRPLLLSWRQ